MTNFSVFYITGKTCLGIDQWRSG